MKIKALLLIPFLLFSHHLFAQSQSTSNKQNLINEIEQFEFIDKKEVSVKFPVKPKELPLLSAIVIDEYVESLDRISQYKLDDLTFSITNNEYLLHNKTPQKVKQITVNYQQEDGSDGSALLRFDRIVKPFSSVIFELPGITLSRIQHNNQMKLFLPHVIFPAKDSSCERTPKQCYLPPNSEQKKVYNTHLVMLHNAMNTAAFHPFINRVIEAYCPHFRECVAYGDKPLSYASRNMLALGAEGHKLNIRVLAGDYFAAGAGGGDRPWLLYKRATNTSGRVAVFHDYITRGSGHYRPYHQRTYNTFFHETNHAYGFSHDSAMTYGLGVPYSHRFITENFSDIEMTSIGDIKQPATFVTTSLNEKNQITLSFYSLPNEGDYGKVSMSMLGLSLNSGTLPYSVDNNGEPVSNTIVLDFKQLPTATSYLRFGAEQAKYTSTIKLAPNDLVPDKYFSINDKRFSLLEDRDLLDIENDGRRIRHLCKNMDMLLATKEEYQQFWSYLKEAGQLSTLTNRRFLSRDEPARGQIWRLEFTEDEMLASRQPINQKFGSDKSLVCVR